MKLLLPLLLGILQWLTPATMYGDAPQSRWPFTATISGPREVTISLHRSPAIQIILFQGKDMPYESAMAKPLTLREGESLEWGDGDHASTTLKAEEITAKRARLTISSKFTWPGTQEQISRSELIVDAAK